MLGDYSGWKEYQWGMGHQRSREIRQYMDEPVWLGQSGQLVVAYGEQGLGDEILLSQVLTDVKHKTTLIYETHSKLAGLMRRSFGVETHGTRLKKDIDWAGDRKIDASISLTQLHTLYRTNAHDWDGKPYLAPDAERVVQWQALLDSLGPGPKIGIAWTGGTTANQRRDRSTTLQNFLPFTLLSNAHFISLEYQDCSEEIEAFKRLNNITIHDWPRATQTDDYDDTAGLVAALDMVIAVPTTVVHLAGALGIPCHCLVHQKPHFFFGLEGSTMPQYNSVTLHRGDKGRAIETIAGLLREREAA
jgi:hypothetical protein